MDTGKNRYSKNTDRSLSVYGYEHTTSKRQLYVIWNDECIPSNSNTTRNISFTFINGSFQQPVYVDLITGAVYEIPAGKWSRDGNRYIFTDMPVYDSPVLIADKSLIVTR
jgi:hypothetical protein